MSKPKAIALTPTVLDRNGISTTETIIATRLDFLINGAGSTGYDIDAIVVAANPVAGTAMTLVSTNFVAQGGAYVLIDSDGAGDHTGGTFVVVGLDKNGNSIKETITGPDANLIVAGSTLFHYITSVTPAGSVHASDVTVGVNGYITFTTPQHVAIYSAGNDSGDTFTVIGDDRYSKALSDAITGASAGTALGVANFAVVRRISNSSASAGAVEGGWVGTCESQWYVLNYRGKEGFNVGLGASISSGGAMTYDVEHTFDNVFASTFTENGANVFNHATIVAQTASLDGTYTSPPTACRSAITAYTSGTLTLSIVQNGGA